MKDDDFFVVLGEAKVDVDVPFLSSSAARSPVTVAGIMNCIAERFLVSMIAQIASSSPDPVQTSTTGDGP